MSESVTREQLYEMVWSEAMLQVAKRFGVSSSYMARVCTDLRVPRPARGYWAKLQHGQVIKRPPLPAALPGDATVWSKGLQRTRSYRSLIRPSSSEGAHPGRSKKPAPEAKHGLVAGARELYLKSRASEVGLLRPYKRLLADIVVGEGLLDDTLDFANKFFVALTSRGHRVVLAPPDARMRRSEVDEREVPNKNRFHRPVWSPDRVTVAYIKGIPIGLTIFEMTEETEMMYVDGRYLPVRTLTPEQVRRFKPPRYWTTTKSGISGRRCLQAYCPHWRVNWTRQWRETRNGQLPGLIEEIIRELEVVAPELQAKLEEAERQAETERVRWEQEREQAKLEAERAWKAKARADARVDLLRAISSWDEARRIVDFFEAVEREAEHLGDEQRAWMLDRLDKARQLVGGIDGLEVLRHWRAPEERYAATRPVPPSGTEAPSTESS